MKKLLVVAMLAMLVGCSDSSRLYFSEIEPALSTCMLHGGVTYIDVAFTPISDAFSGGMLFSPNKETNYETRQ